MDAPARKPSGCFAEAVQDLIGLFALLAMAGGGFLMFDKDTVAGGAGLLATGAVLFALRGIYMELGAIRRLLESKKDDVPPGESKSSDS